MFAKMTIKKQYQFFLQQLRTIYTLNEATIITDWVMESIAGIERFEVLKNPDNQFSAIILQHLNIALTALLQHKPVQYVTGEAWFYNIKFKVDENVLIPRPETAELVQLVIDEVKTSENSAVTILDIGTGSGCIAISLKKNLPAITIAAIDVSDKALIIAKENAITQKVEIDFIQLDFLNEDEWLALPTFDIIISNPPYIPLNEKDKLDKNVTAFEPHQALFVQDNSPLLFYEKIAAFASTHLNKNGKIFMETHEDFARETAALFVKYFSTSEVKKDLFGKQRMVVVTY